MVCCRPEIPTQTTEDVIQMKQTIDHESYNRTATVTTTLPVEVHPPRTPEQHLNSSLWTETSFMACQDCFQGWEILEKSGDMKHNGESCNLCLAHGNREEAVTLCHDIQTACYGRRRPGIFQIC